MAQNCQPGDSLRIVYARTEIDVIVHRYPGKIFA
jgi:hypothetical protein